MGNPFQLVATPLPRNSVGPTCWSAAGYPTQPKPRSSAALPGEGDESENRSGSWCLSRRTLLGGLLLAAGSALAQPTAPEHEIKANLLARLSQHLEWPASVFTTKHQPIVIGILGEAPFSAEFEEALRAFKPTGRPLKILRLRRAEEASDCQLLYLHASEDGKLKTLLGTLKGKPVFTTGDHPDLLKHGGVLRFWRKGDSLAFHISEDALRAAKVTANPRLLQLSDDPAKPR